MKIINNKEKIWAEKYRPKTISDVILPSELQQFFNKVVSTKNLPNILLTSTAGLGKGSIISALINDLDYEVMFLNGSRENSIIDMRTTLHDFISKVNIMNTRKMVIIDEADRLTPQAQDSLKSDIEMYSNITSFIFTTNHIDRIIEPLQNRLQVFDLNLEFNKDKKNIIKNIYERLVYILENENIKYNKNDILKVIKYFYPSIRKMIIYIQQHSFDNELRIDDITNKDELLLQLKEYLIHKDYGKIIEFVNNFSNYEYFFTFFYNNILEFFEAEYLPNIVIEIAKYQNYLYFANNKKIPILAFLSYILLNDIKIKK